VGILFNLIDLLVEQAWKNSLIRHFMPTIIDDDPANQK